MTRLQIETEGGRVTFGGRIDETAQLASLVAQMPPGPVVLVPEGVTFVNSVGLREWIRFLRALREGGHAVTLECVADVLMTQMNLIGELRGLDVMSFHAQYECPTCRNEDQPLVDATLAPVACRECGSPMQLADFPERYLTIFRT
jgi:anti-anti-sigma regulatory factor/DNA-directed RNA polymerase subunit RPC12/RpoP